MDNKIEVFKNEQFGEIRTALIENEPWFVAVDVCRALEIGNSSQAISRLDADEKMITLISNEGNKRGNPNMTVVNEPGLYTLICAYMAQNTPADWQGDYVSVYRVNKTRDFTVMGNTHLRDKNLSLKAVGLLSKMLSFNDGWQFSTRGLAAICKEGPDAILSALKELEKNGYLVRHRGRDSKGRLITTEFDIYESPQAGLPHREKPHRENPDVDSPDVENPHRDNPTQINTIQVTNQERNTLSKNYQSINLDGIDRMDERSEYEEIIKENLDYDILCQDPKFDKDRFREIMDIMLDAVCSTAPTIRINGEDMPQQVVKSRFLKLNSSHIEYVLDAMNKNPSDIRNIRAYLLTALYQEGSLLQRCLPRTPASLPYHTAQTPASHVFLQAHGAAGRDRSHGRIQSVSFEDSNPY